MNRSVSAVAYRAVPPNPAVGAATVSAFASA